METFNPLPTANQSWGFWGTSVRNGYDAALAWDAATQFLVRQFGLSGEQARDVLDSKFGRHLADDLSFIRSGPISAQAIIMHLSTRLQQQGWHESFVDAIAEVTGLPCTVSKAVN